MCGISGILAKAGITGAHADVRRMSGLLKHRGPDHTGFYSSDDGVIHLGFNRLSIVDLSQRGNQPMFNEDKDIAMVVNGEIYNYKELRRELESAGHKFSSHTDSETVIHAYEQWGDEFIGHLRGMFALALWDAREKRLLLARDRIGIKPLYYMNGNNALCFASEVKAFLGLRREIWSPEINDDALGKYISLPFIIDNENTILRQINKLPPAHIAIFQNGSLRLKRYWRLAKQGDLKISFEEAVESTEKMIKESINYHLIGDVPVALMLSGGLDSSLIGALALNCNKNLSLAVTIGHDYPYDERDIGGRVADYLGIEHQKVDVDYSLASSMLEEIVWHIDDLSLTGMFYQFFTSLKLRELGLKTVILGQGADEIFGGYHIFKLSQFPFNMLPDPAWTFLHYRMLSNKKPDSSYLTYLKLFNQLGITNERDLFDRMTRYEIELQVPNYNCVADDKGYMSHSIEARVPYLDHKLVEFVYSLPSEYKLKGSFFTRDHKAIKFLLRTIAKKYLPAEIAGRKKQGTGMSTGELIRHDPDKTRDYLLSGSSISRQLFGVKKIKRMLSDQKKNSPMLTRLFILEVWRKKFIGSQGSA